MEIKKSDLKCICCGNYCYEEVWGENDTNFVCYVCKRRSELKKAEERKAKKYEQFMKCGELLQGIMRTEYGEILTEIRDYLEKQAEWDMLEDEHRIKASFVEKALADLTEYAEKLGVEL